MQTTQSAALTFVSEQKNNLLLRGSVELDRRYLLGEPVLVRLEVINVGEDDLIVPFDPGSMYRTLFVSAVFPDGQTWGSAAGGNAIGPPPAELAPEESRQEQYDMYAEFPVREPGIYRLKARFETDGRWRRRVPGETIEGDGWSGALHIYLGEVEIVRPEAPHDIAALAAVTPPEGRGHYVTPDVRWRFFGALYWRANRRLLIDEHPDSYYTGYARYYEAENALRGAGNWRVHPRTVRRALELLEPIDRAQYPKLFQEMVLHRLILAHVGAESEAEVLRPLVREFREQFPDSPYELPEAAR